jgi:hypothetical protein
MFSAGIPPMNDTLPMFGCASDAVGGEGGQGAIYASRDNFETYEDLPVYVLAGILPVRLPSIPAETRPNMYDCLIVLSYLETSED